MAVKELERKKGKKKHVVGKILGIIQLILSILCLGLVIRLDMLPSPYVVGLGAVLLILWLIVLLSQHSNNLHIPGKILSLLLCIGLIVVSYYVFVTGNALSELSGKDYKVDKVVFIVKKDSEMESLADAENKKFGIQTTMDRTNTDKAIQEVEAKQGYTLSTVAYDSLEAQVNALYNSEIDVAVINEGYRGIIEEEFETFSDDTKVLENVVLKSQVEKEAQKQISEEPFNVYVSGIDVFGDVSTTSRSDVNMIATINPKTKQILLTSTPRDYYVAFPDVTNGAKDKLTHAGIYGIDCSMKTLEEIYGISIDYYVRINFTSLINIVDALGGIDVHSDYDFTTRYTKIHYNKGMNHMNGEEALSFARERKNLTDGDIQRGKDQQYVIQGIIDKATSPAILSGYSGIMKGLADNIQTNITNDDMKELVKMQLDDNAQWNIKSVTAGGTYTREYCYSYQGKALCVMIPDSESTDYIATVMQKVVDGEELTDEDTKVPGKSEATNN